jgi:hypothetical protein
MAAEVLPGAVIIIQIIGRKILLTPATLFYIFTGRLIQNIPD